MTQAYSMVAIIAFSLAGLGLGATVFIWFKYKILDIINDLSGKTARKSIAQLRMDNEKSGVKIHRATIDAYKRGKITEKIEKIQENPPRKTELKGTPTEKLDNIDVNATDVLTTEELAEAVGGQTSGTERLSMKDETSETTAELTGGMETEQLPMADGGSKTAGKLKIIQEIVKIHTDETI